MKKIGEVTVTDEEYLHLIGFWSFTKFPRTPNEWITQKTTYWTGFACEYKFIVSKVKVSLRFLFLLNLLEITFLICWFWEIFLRILVFAGLSQISKHSVLWYTIGITPCSSGCPFARNTLIFVIYYDDITFIHHKVGSINNLKWLWHNSNNSNSKKIKKSEILLELFSYHRNN
jgi:hypothetical protein